MIPALLLCASAWAIDGNDHVRAELVAGAEYSGAFHSTTGALLRLTRDGDQYEFAVALIDQVWINDEPVAVDDFRQELQAWDDTHGEAIRELARTTPPPWVVGTASAIWPGAGHAMLGEWGHFAGYSVVEGILIGTGVWWARDGRLPALIPLAGVDLIFRSYSVVESTRTAQRRRAPLVVMVGPGRVQVAGRF